MDINKALDTFKRIQALAENPHWTSDRRWRIGELAGEGMTALAGSASPTPPDVHVYVAVGPNCWGKGFSQGQAIAEMRRNWSRTHAGQYNSKRVTILTCTDPWCYVDEMGGLVRHEDSKVIYLQEARS